MTGGTVVDFDKDIDVNVDINLSFDVKVDVDKTTDIDVDIKAYADIVGNIAELTLSVEAYGFNTYTQADVAILTVAFELSSIDLYAVSVAY
jgi:hypothetical protein